ncbi:flavodoxin [Klebsiella variicola]|uniref:flavodoxin n=1 Tax=Klebsiella variicola TaxID=244366 RepID=UPI001E377C06|nr:flavodoxin [Klebsiella variicola]MCD6603695.1 flavodoxin [Klebsiella variicola subsp. variicola]
MKIAIVYGSTTRYTERVACKIAAQPGFEEAELLDIEDTALSDLLGFDFIIFGIPTWDYGEVQSSWQTVWDEIDNLDFSNKLCAFFGLGDQQGYPQWFVDAMGLLHDKIVRQGGIAIGDWSTEGYRFNTQLSLSGNRFVGLPLDEVNQDDLTDERISAWCRQLCEITG